MARLAGSLPLVGESIRRWLRAPVLRPAALWIAVGFNVALIGLYLWSRGGGVTDVRIEVMGGNYRAYVDGRLVVLRSIPGHPTGGIAFRIRPSDNLPSLPRPAGIDSVRVTDTRTGAVLLADNFGGAIGPQWTIATGHWHTDAGTLSMDGNDGIITAGSNEWQDYVVDTKVRNLESVDISVRGQNVGNYLDLGLQLYGGYTSGLTVVEGPRQTSLPGSSLQLSHTQTIRSMMAMLLRPYPTALLLIAGAIAIALFGRFAWLERRADALGRSLIISAGAIMLVLIFFAFILLWYINFFVLDHMPHVPDSVLYIFQSKIFASFRLTAPAPPVRESFSIFRPHMNQFVDGRWFSHYPFGHPMFLAFGEVIHAVWLVPPVLGAACVFLIFRLGKHVYGTSVGLLAAVLLLFSPFFQMSASEFMSHNTAAFLILMCLFLKARPTRRPLASLFLSGIFLGLLFNTRPLTAISFIPPLAGLMGYELVRAGPTRLEQFRSDLAFCAGALLMLFAYFLYNRATTGSFTESAYALQGTYSTDSFGFGGSHTVAYGLQNQRQLLSLMLLVANGWPVFIGFAFAALPFLLGTRHRWDYYLAAAASTIAGANILYKSAAIMYGPRFWYEATAFLMLLTARGTIYLRDAAVDGARRLRVHLRGSPAAASPAITGLAVIGLVLGLTGFSAYGWMLDQREAWSGIPLMPAEISQLHEFNFSDGRLLTKADELHLKNALVLVQRCTNWWCFGSVFWTNAPDLNGNIVWANQQNNQDDVMLLDHYPGRSLYLANYDLDTLVPVTRDDLVRQANAQQISPSTPALRDDVRQADFQNLSDALLRFHDDHGSYPNTLQQIEPLCINTNSDAGCALPPYLSAIPADPLTGAAYHGYWYTSDGTSYILIAERETLSLAGHGCSLRVVVMVMSAGYCIGSNEQ